MRIPEELWGVAGKREIKESLKTKDPKEARFLVMRARARAVAEIESYRRTLAGGGVATRVDDMSDDELWLLMSQWFVEKERADLTSAPVNAEERLQDLGWLLDEGDTSASASVHSATKRFLKQRNIDLDERSPTFARLSSLLRRAMVEHDKRLINRVVSSGFALDPSLTHLTSQTDLRGLEPVRLGDLIDRYESDRARRTLSPKGKLKRDGHVRVIKDFFGERTLIGEIDRNRLLDFRETLQRLPPNATKRFPGLTPQQIVQLPPEKLKYPPMEAATANPYISLICRFLSFAHSQGSVARLPSFADLMFDGAGHTEFDKEPFTRAELQRLFSAPLYTGCVDDEKRYARPGPNHPRRGRFWVPLISLFSGARLNEVCQLRENEVIEVGGVPLIRTSDEGADQRLKNASARRYVPIHPELVAIGFLSFVAERRKAGGIGARLFPELTMASTGYYSDNFSKWFRHLADSRDIPKSMHSFRHNFNDACTLGKIPPDRVGWVAGWSAKDTQGRYGKGVETRAKIVAEEIGKVRYEDLDLSFLHVSSDNAA